MTWLNGPEFPLFSFTCRSCGCETYTDDDPKSIEPLCIDCVEPDYECSECGGTVGDRPDSYCPLCNEPADFVAVKP